MSILPEIFAPAEDGRERPRRIEQARELPHFLLEQQARALLLQALRHADDRGVRAVRRAEGVVHVDVGQRRQLRGELGIVALFAGVEAQVLEQQDLARGERVRRLRGLGTDALLDEAHGLAEQLRQPHRDRRERELGLLLALRLAEVGRAEDPRPLLEREAQRRQRLGDARVVGHAAAVERHVEIDPQEEFSPLERQFSYGFHRAGRIAQ